jgi:virulence factor Mce-like protein
MRRKACATAFLVACSIALPSCASVSFTSLPQPGPTYGDGYDIALEFANVLNLPDQAKVVLDGTTVGKVTSVDLAPDHVTVRARIARDVDVPLNVEAVLQQATVLGDIYVALERPPTDKPAGPPLPPGGVVPVTQTTSPPQLEDTIAHLANFVGSGSIQRIQNTIIGLNRVAPPGDGAIRRVSHRAAVDLRDLSDNIDQVDSLLTSVSETASVVENRIPSFQHWFSPLGMLGWIRAFRPAGYVGELLPSVGSVYSNGFWLVPLLSSLANTLGAIQESKWAFEDEVPAWRQLFTDYFLPQDKYPAVNITSIIAPDGREVSGNVHDVLRILGAMP